MFALVRHILQGLRWLFRKQSVVLLQQQHTMFLCVFAVDDFQT